MPSKIIPFSKLDLQTRYATLHARGFTVVGGVLVQFIKCMYLSGERLCRFQAARTAVQIPGAVVACPVSGLRLNCCFLIFSASSMPRIVTAAVSNRLNPSIGRIRCFIRR